jgi:endonuclease G, mitochondrial
MFDATYKDRKGFDPSFLAPGKRDGRVFLPTLSAALAKVATPLIANTSNVLDYHRFSLVMHRKRRFAIYSAANVDFSGRFVLKRPKDVWRLDPRIDAAAQVTESFYTNNQFDRGHLTRREDLEYGVDPSEALTTAADTCHWTNCTPQHARFNENAQLWQGLEKHILERAVAKDRFRAQVITGPIFDAKDPKLDGFADTPYPLRFWKVVAAIDARGKLFATAYVLDQRGVIGKYGVRGAPDVPFTTYKTFQTTIAEIERLTGLLFKGGKGAKIVALSRFDPLGKARQVPGSVTRSGPASAAPGVPPWFELGSLDDVVVDATA